MTSRYSLLHAFLLLALVLPLRSQVAINEMSSTQSDRVLQFPSGQPARLGTLAPAWYQDGYDAAFWKSGAGPHGFGSGTFGTIVSAPMLAKTPSLYLRKTFTVTAGQAASTSALSFSADYADGFVAYINGVEVARKNLGPAGAFVFHDQITFNTHEPGTVENIALGNANTRLRAGENVLCIQVHNNALAEGGTDLPDTAPGGGNFKASFALVLAGAGNLVNANDTWQYLVGSVEPSGGLYDPANFADALPLGPNWTQPTYADAAWTEAPGAIGFEAGSDYYRASDLPNSQLGVNLTGMRYNQLAVFMRRSFALTQAELDGITSLNLTVDWDDGYVLYLNGYEISRASLPGAPGTFVAWNQAATGHDASTDNGRFNNPLAGVVQTVSVPKSLLVAGNNVISAQLHNSTLGSSDLMLDVRFSSNGAVPLTLVTKGSTWRYLIPTSEIGTPAPAVAASAPEFHDWVELRNTTNAAVSLAGWSLSDQATLTPPETPWFFPAGAQIPANGYLVVACSKRNITAPPVGGLYHTDFALDADGEGVFLRNAGGTIVSSVTTVPDQTFFHTWGYDAAANAFRYHEQATPGAANAGAVFTAIASRPTSDRETGFYNGTTMVTLATATPGATIRYTTDGSEPTASTGTLYTAPFDAQTVGQVNLGPGAGYILAEKYQWAAGVYVSPPNIPTTGATSTELIQQLETTSHIADNYSTRVKGFIHPPTSGSYQFFLATDDEGELWLSTDANPANKQRIAYVPGWTSPREWTKYAEQASAPVTLWAGQRYYIEVLQSEGGGGDNLALGWTRPTNASITVVEGRYLSPPDGPLPPGATTPARAVTVRSRAFASGQVPSEVLTRNYACNFAAAVRTIPAIFLSGEAGRTFYAPYGFFAQQGGTFASGDWVPNDVGADYNFCLMRGQPFERPMVFESVKTDGTLDWRTTLGGRFAGSPWSRPKYQLGDIAGTSWNASWVSKPQFNLYFRGDLGESTHKQQGFIPGSHLNEWDTLRLRAGKNDAYNPFIIDEWMRRQFRAMGNHPAPLGYFSSVFINGQLKSYFNVTERPRDSFFEEFYDASGDWDVNYIWEWESGDTAAWNQMISFFLSNDFSTLANYQTGTTYWDLSNVADYFIINAWGGTKDWPGNNFAFARERVAGAKWRYSMWDAEGALGMFGQPNTTNTFTEDLLISGDITQDYLTPRVVFRRFYQSPEFRLYFADRLQRHFFNTGIMTTAAANARWNDLKNQISAAMYAISGQTFTNYHWDNWAGRNATFLQQCRDLGLWPATEAPAMAPFGGSLPVGGTVALTRPGASGTIYYTTDGTDPRATGGTIAGASYTAPITITQPTTIKARVLNGAEWSALTEANFAPPPPRVVFSEIYYNPPGSSDATEFLELTNVGGTPISLNGATFTSGIVFTFGNTSLAAGQRLTLVRDATAFATAYPGVPITGTYTGSLRNSGDTITLVDIAGAQICTATYGTAAPWPTTADGDGYSLILINPATATAYSDPTSYRPSTTTGGNPGATDSTPFTGPDPLADADGDGRPALLEYALGTSDTDPLSVPAPTITRDPQGRLQYTLTHPLGRDNALIEALQSPTLTTWTPATLVSTTNHNNGTATTTWRTTTATTGFLRLRAVQVP